MVVDCLEPPSEVPVESGHYLSSLVPPSSHRGIGGSEGVVGTQNSVEVKEGLRSPLVRDHHNHLSLVRPTHRLGWDYTVHNQ